MRKPGGIFYTASTGIWQTVWLEPVDGGMIEALKIMPDLDTRRCASTVQIAATPRTPNVPATAFDGDKEVAAAEGSSDDELALKIPDAEAVVAGVAVPVRAQRAASRGCTASGTDEVDSYFAMRKIEVGKDDKGVTRHAAQRQAVFQVGPLDQGFWPDGLYTAPTDEALKYDIEMTKKLGFNMIRKHVKVEPDRWYYWCDKLGLLVWQDMPSGDKRSVAPGKRPRSSAPRSRPSSTSAN